MDLYLVYRCKFYIGTQSGPLDLSFMFNKPTLITNALSIFLGIPKNKKSMMLMKKIYLKKKKIIFKNFLKLPFKYNNPCIEENPLVFKENSKNEILLAVKEFLNKLNNKKRDFSIKKNYISNLIYNELKNKFHFDKTAKHPIFQLAVKWNDNFNRGSISRLSL